MRHFISFTKLTESTCIIFCTVETKTKNAEAFKCSRQTDLHNPAVRSEKKVQCMTEMRNKSSISERLELTTLQFYHYLKDCVTNNNILVKLVHLFAVHTACLLALAEGH